MNNEECSCNYSRHPPTHFQNNNLMKRTSRGRNVVVKLIIRGELFLSTTTTTYSGITLNLFFEFPTSGHRITKIQL